MESAPQTFFKPPYVGVRGWVGLKLDQISDEDLTFHIQVAWELIAPKRLVSMVKAEAASKERAQKRVSQ